MFFQTVDCTSGKMLSSLELELDSPNKKWRYRYNCCTPSKVPDTCRSYTTAQTAYAATLNYRHLIHLPVKCPKGQYLSRMKYRWGTIMGRYDYTCCGYENPSVAIGK